MILELCADSLAPERPEFRPERPEKGPAEVATRSDTRTSPMMGRRDTVFFQKTTDSSSTCMIARLIDFWFFYFFFIAEGLFEWMVSPLFFPVFSPFSPFADSVASGLVNIQNDYIPNSSPSSGSSSSSSGGASRFLPNALGARKNSDSLSSTGHQDSKSGLVQPSRPTNTPPPLTRQDARTQMYERWLTGWVGIEFRLRLIVIMEINNITFLTFIIIIIIIVSLLLLRWCAVTCIILIQLLFLLLSLFLLLVYDYYSLIIFSLVICDCLSLWVDCERFFLSVSEFQLLTFRVQGPPQLLPRPQLQDLPVSMSRDIALARPDWFNLGEVRSDLYWIEWNGIESCFLVRRLRESFWIERDQLGLLSIGITVPCSP